MDPRGLSALSSRNPLSSRDLCGLRDQGFQGWEARIPVLGLFDDVRDGHWSDVESSLAKGTKRAVHLIVVGE